MATITSIVKNGIIIEMAVLKKKNPIRYNMETGELTSWSGKPYQSTPEIILSGSLDYYDALLLQALKHDIRDREFSFWRSEYLKKIELFAGAKDVVQGISIEDVSPQCPRGFIKWLRENHEKATKKALYSFQSESKRKELLQRLSKEELAFVDILTEGNILVDYKCNIPSLDEYLAIPYELRKTFMKIFKTTEKRGCWYLHQETKNFLHQETKNFLHRLLEVITSPDMCQILTKILDTNRDFKHNMDLIDVTKNQHRYPHLLENEKKIKEIENLSNSNFKVVVPTSFIDFMEEGRSQNNCVGYYYHFSIEKCENLVYFIRHADTPDKSYITNRYKVNEGKTVETRLVNNQENNDKAALAFIKVIDEKIHELLNT